MLMASLLATAPAMAAPGDPGTVVSGFMADVRSGKSPDRAFAYMHAKVLAHQMNAEGETVVERTPAQYADHIRGFITTFGKYDFKVTEQIAQDDRVYVRWQQDGLHLATIDGELPSNKPLREIASAVFRVQDGKIAEYWIQIDRYGLDRQLKIITAAADAAGAKK
jgi:predicted ester cyclase